ncbi:MAG TPA: hypothetical protein VFU14_00360 [Acidimicrobiales bacterium]|nr:hypothetical protein [Acidimicrobiales bacterium]
MVVASFHLARFPSATAATARVPVDRLALRRVPGLRFGRLLGTGRGRTMSASADLHRWAIFAVWDDEAAAERFRSHRLSRRWDGAGERFDVLLRPLGAHGAWSRIDPLGDDSSTNRCDESDESPTNRSQHPAGPVAVLTRATVRWRHVPAFLRSVPAVDAHLHTADGLLQAVGIGELPVGRQATFSLWRDAEAMTRFAYRSAEHVDVVQRTRDHGWYGEEWFARFQPVAWSGTWDGGRPLG